MSKIKGIDLESKTVILSPKYYGGDEKARTVLCTGGFGCSPTARGTAVFATFNDGSKGRVERYEIEKLAKSTEGENKDA